MLTCKALEETWTYCSQSEKMSKTMTTASLHLFHDATCLRVQSLIFMTHFKNVFLLSRLFWRIMCSESGVSHLQIALAFLGFVLWLGDSSFDQMSALDILYLCIFVDHFYWEQIISFSWKCVIHLMFFFS